MNITTPGGARPWHRFYDDGVSTSFVPEETTWTDMMSDRFDRFSGNVFLEYYGETYTYAEMQALVSQAAAALRAFGIQKGDRVALHLPNCPWHPIFFFAVLAVGGAVTHLSPLDADREIAHKLKDSGARLVITLTTPELADHYETLMAAGEVPTVIQCHDPISAAGRDCPVLDGALAVQDFLADHQNAAWTPVPVSPSDMALLQYTGGTTGVPKAAVLSHRNLSAAVLMYSEMSKAEPAVAPGQPALVYGPLFHIMGLVTAMMKRFWEGGPVHLRQRYDPAQALDEIETHRIATLSGVPTVWIGLLRVPGVENRDLSSLRYIASGGAPLPVETYNRIRALTGMKLRGGWGMTEIAPSGTQVPRNTPEDKLGTIGVPMPGVDMTIVDTEDASRTLAPGETGEIAIRGPNVMSGYWNKPEETAAAFHDDWFLTGDIGYMDEDGFFFLVDRKKDMILSGGFNVYPLMIENAVHQHPDVSEAIAIGVPDSYRGESAKVFVVLNANAKEFSLEDLRAFLSDKLGRHEIPRLLEFRASLPHTPVGKADRKALKAEEMAKGAISEVG
ncbi:AMP-binding protein [Phaeobacter marinintestinus]|uniref:AMP-binding protein n=1 Tax=Falsiphaeobacter marinintestinus TaxID=1492905 RepID=UPI00164475A7|nr:AMP-binding protein [Phaeobacter marinintestinus]